MANENKPTDKTLDAKVIAAAVAEVIAKQRFGPVECQITDSTVSDRYGRKSVKVLDVIVPLPLIGMRVNSALYGNLEVKSDGTEISFTAYIPKKFMSAMDDDSRERFLAHVENGAASWVGFDKATAAAAAKLTGQSKKVAAGEIARPRLVKAVKAETAA